MSFVASLHFAVGCFAVITGFLALFVKKGSGIHKLSGKVYTLSIIKLTKVGTGGYIGKTGKAGV
jgi:uncharacterized membrane protein